MDALLCSVHKEDDYGAQSKSIQLNEQPSHYNRKEKSLGLLCEQ